MPQHNQSVISYEQALTSLAAILNDNFSQRSSGSSPVRILEAGCGQCWILRNELKFPYHLTGVDLDHDALALRMSEQRDLHAAVHGDLLTVKFPDHSFDVIYCAFVLEHISGAGKVLASFRNWISPGGFIVITIPDRASGFGLLTRLTPHWFHVFYYRIVLGIKSAGKPGYAPYRTYHDKAISLRSLREFATNNGLEVRLELLRRELPEKGIAKLIVDSVLFAVHLLSFGIFTSAHNNLTVVFRKKSS